MTHTVRYGTDFSKLSLLPHTQQINKSILRKVDPGENNFNSERTSRALQEEYFKKVFGAIKIFCCVDSLQHCLLAFTFFTTDGSVVPFLL